MAICGCCCGCIREFGAFGFSNEKSLMYCAITPRFGCAAASSAALPPFVELAISVPLRLPAMRVHRFAVWLTQAIRPNKATYRTVAKPLPNGGEHRFGSRHHGLRRLRRGGNSGPG